MSRNYKFHDPDGLYFVTSTVVHWIDVFTRRQYKEIIIDSLNYCVGNKGLVVHAYVIMSNHIHIIISKSSSDTSFSAIMRDFKKFTATHIIKAIKENIQESRQDWILKALLITGKRNANNKNYQFWQQHNHPIQIEGEMIDQKLEYIHYNPVKAGWVLEPQEFYYSSARNYAGLEIPLKISSIFDGTLI